VAPESPAGGVDIVSCLNSSDPTQPNDGDAQLSVSAGSTATVSVLAAVVHGQIQALRPPRAMLSRFLPSSDQLSMVRPGSVPLGAMLAELSPRLKLDLWYMRLLGFLIIWLGMSLMLFPNRLNCGGCCCLRSFPGALATIAVTIISVHCYAHAPRSTGVVAAVLIPFLLATSAGVDVLNCAKLFGRSTNSGSRIDATLLPSPSDIDLAPAVTKAVRVTALSIGLGLTVAGPMVKTAWVVDVFGFYVYAATK